MCQKHRMSEANLARFWRWTNIGNCEFADLPGEDDDALDKQHYARRLFYHLSSSSSMLESGFTGTIEEYKKVCKLA